MSILKRILIEDIAPLLRRPKASDRVFVAPSHPIPSAGSPPLSIEASASPAHGMKAVILNWRKGENDPFTVVSGTIRDYLRACGKDTVILETADPAWTSQLEQLAPGVEFAYAWQGLGSAATSGTTSIWERLKIPLICIHGDHPSHMPLNHQLESRYCFHLYTNAEFARYSNRHFRRRYAAGVIDIPQLFREPELERRQGDYFVLAKNIHDPVDTESFWRQRLDPSSFDLYMAGVETLKGRIARDPYVDIHDVLDEVLIERGFESSPRPENMPAYHQYHSQVDHYFRSYKTIAAVTSMRQFPVRIYGRGWTRIARDSPTCHVFERGQDMADSQQLFYSRFGIVDVSPSKGLHDRTRRAMSNGTAFLSSANVEDALTQAARFERLFYTFQAEDLAEKAAAAMARPEEHLALSRQFATIYHERFHYKGFVRQIELLAKLAVGARS